MTREAVMDDYFEWLCKIVCENRYSKKISYRRLLKRLHEVDFTSLLSRDDNRAEDGIGLRCRFAYGYVSPASAETFLDMPCSVLEMILALAIRCEETIMDNPSFGDRTGQWFWGMINNLGLGSMTDDNFDTSYVDFVVDRFLDREYEANGRGGLFTIRNCEYDLRDAEIWYQLCWYLASIT